MNKQNERLVARHEKAVNVLKDKSALELALAKAKRESSAAIDALRSSIEILELAHIHSRVEVEATLSASTPERLRSQLAEFAVAEERLSLLVRVPEKLRDPKWQKDWSVTCDRRERACRSVIQAGLILAKGGSLEAASEDCATATSTETPGRSNG